MDLVEVIMKRFLRRLFNLNIWGGRHTELKHIYQTLPSHLRGCKESKLALRELVRKEFIILKLSTGEKHVSLNSHKQKEICDFLEGSDNDSLRII